MAKIRKVLSGFDHYSHRVDHSNPVVEISFSLLVQEREPEFSAFLQGVADGVMKLLRELREDFSRQKFDYYGIRFDEWLAGVPTQEPYLMSKKDLPTPDPTRKDLERTTEFTTARIEHLADEHPKVQRKVNEGVAPHVITRKYFPFSHCVSCNKRNTDYCRLVCEDESTIEEFSHEKDISPIDITIFVPRDEDKEDFSHEK